MSVIRGQADGVAAASGIIPEDAAHHPKRHAAARTDSYVYSQVIPYIGNKRKLLRLISQAILRTHIPSGTFVDLFTGSTVVGRLAKTMGYRVVANDWEPYSHEIALGSVVPNEVPNFEILGGVERVFRSLNEIEPVHGYIAKHLCPVNDDHPNPDVERMFFTRANGERIDAIREQIESWECEGKLSAVERAYILTSLVYAVSYVSNTSGVFKGWHYGWGGKTSTALYRILSTLNLQAPVIFDNGHKNIATREDALQLAGKLRTELGSTPDIVYIDPPYNQHPYGSNYHVLNTVTLWDKPPLNPHHLVDGRKVDKSAIRKDWRTERRSPFNHTRDALSAFETLLDRLEAKSILLSYSTDGNMPLHDVLRAMACHGALDICTQTYKRYRVSTPRMSPKSHNVEFVAIVDTTKKPCPSRADQIAEAIETQEFQALNQSAHEGEDQLPLFSS